MLLMMNLCSACKQASNRCDSDEKPQAGIFPLPVVTAEQKVKAWAENE